MPAPGSSQQSSAARGPGKPPRRDGSARKRTIRNRNHADSLRAHQASLPKDRENPVSSLPPLGGVRHFNRSQSLSREMVRYTDISVTTLNPREVDPETDTFLPRHLKAQFPDRRFRARTVRLNPELTMPRGFGSYYVLPHVMPVAGDPNLNGRICRICHLKPLHRESGDGVSGPAPVAAPLMSDDYDRQHGELLWRPKEEPPRSVLPTGPVSVHHGE